MAATPSQNKKNGGELLGKMSLHDPQSKQTKELIANALGRVDREEPGGPVRQQLG